MTAYRLRSLWDMLTFNSSSFFEAAAHLKMMHQAITGFLQAQSRGDIRLDVSGLLRTQSVLKKLQLECEALDLAMTNLRVEKLATLIDEICSRPTQSVPGLAAPDQFESVLIPRLQADYLSNLLHVVLEIIKDELATRKFLQVAPAEVKLYEQTRPLFGSDVAIKFPSLAYEIDQGGKSLALELSTASAFHFIRCLEGGIAGLSRSLGIPDPTKGSERSWMKLLDKVKNAIDAKWPSSANRFSGDGRFFEEAHAALAAMQNPYRNATMHLDQKYTPDEARHIMGMVEGFMRKVASRLDENGLPLA